MDRTPFVVDKKWYAAAKRHRLAVLHLFTKEKAWLGGDDAEWGLTAHRPFDEWPLHAFKRHYFSGRERGIGGWIVFRQVDVGDSGGGGVYSACRRAAGTRVAHT